MADMYEAVGDGAELVVEDRVEGSEQSEKWGGTRVACKASTC